MWEEISDKAGRKIPLRPTKLEGSRRRAIRGLLVLDGHSVGDVRQTTGVDGTLRSRDPRHATVAPAEGATGEPTRW